MQNVIEMEGGASALKLTTAGYHRPNGKNIHKFPGAEDSDDWGVIPNSGFEVKLSGKEMTQLMEQRRQKDIVRKPNGEAKPEAAAGDGFVDCPVAEGAGIHQRPTGSEEAAGGARGQGGAEGGSESRAEAGSRTEGGSEEDVGAKAKPNGEERPRRKREPDRG